MADTVVQYVLKVDAKSALTSLAKGALNAQNLSKTLDKLTKETESANEEIEDTEGSSKKATKGLKGLKIAGAAAAGALAGIGTVAVGTIATVGALGSAYIDAQKAAFSFTREVVDSVNDLNDLSAQSGLTAGSIQAVITAFEGSGQSAQAASAFIGRFPRLFADLASGASRASESAARLGISLTDAEGNIKSADTVLIDVTRALQSIEDPTERATEGFLLLGRSAGQFLQAFGATSDFENFLAITERYGVDTAPEASAAAARFQEQLAFLNVVVKGLQQRFVNVVGGVDFFNEKLLQAIKIVVTLQDFIAENEAQFKQLGNSLKIAGNDVIAFFQQALPGFASFVSATFGVITDQIVNTALLLRDLGIVSDETFNAFSKGARSVQSAVDSVAEITSNLGQVDFTGETGQGVGGRTGAKDVEGFLDVLLAGVSDGAKEARPPVEGLATAIDATGDAAREQQAEYDELMKQTLDASKTIESATAQFFPFEAAVLKAEQQLGKLEDAYRLATQQGIPTETITRLITAAEEDLAVKRQAGAKAAEEQRLAAERERKSIDILVRSISNLTNLASQGFADPQSTLESARQKFNDIRGTIEGIDAQSIRGGISNIFQGLGDAKGLQKIFKAALQKVSIIASLDAGAIVSLVSPLLGTFTNLVKGIGETVIDPEKGPEEIRKEALAQAEAIKAGIAFLPELLLSIAPQLGIAIAEAFVDGIQLLIENLINGIKDAFKFLRSTTGQERRQRRRSAIADFFDRDVSASFMGGGRFVPSAQGGIRFTGMKDGLAMLHRGEFVVPQSGQRPQQVDRQLNRTTGGGMTININSAVVDRNAVDALVREIEIRFNNQFGTSSSSLFGGR